jgi:gamma-glutamyltranspeptidase/glutathione hydrolase
MRLRAHAGSSLGRYPNLHEAFEWPRFQTLHLHGSFWLHNTGLNVLNVESTVPDAVINNLRARGYNVQKIRPFSVNGCATSVMIDPASGSRIAGAVFGRIAGRSAGRCAKEKRAA